MENSDVAVETFDNTTVDNNGTDTSTRDDSTHDPSALKISSCTKEQLFEMLAILEAELQARDVSIATLQNEKLRHMLYEAKFGRGCLDDPYLALEHDGAVLGEDLDEDLLMRAAHEAKLIHLENLLIAQHNAVEKIRGQVQLYQTKYSGLSSELIEERKKCENEASQSKVTTAGLEAVTKKLKDELTYERGCVKAYQEDLALMISIAEAMRLDIMKHKRVALMLIKERKLLAECLLKDRQRLKELEDAALNYDNANIEHAVEEKLSKLVQDRAVLEDRFKQEESRHKTTRTECERLRQQVDILQQQLQQQLQMQVASQSAARQSSPLTLSSTMSEARPSIPSNPSPVVISSGTATVRSVATTPSSFTVTSRVPLENAPTIAQRALAPTGASSYSTYRSPTTAATAASSPSMVVGSSTVQPFQSQISLQPNRSPAIVPSSTSVQTTTTPVTPTTSALGAGGGPRLSFLPGQSAVLTTSSGQRISLHVSPSKPVTPTVVPSPNSISNNSSLTSSPSPMVVHVNQVTPQSSFLPNATPNRPSSASNPSLNSSSNSSGVNTGTVRGSMPLLTGNQRPVPPTPQSPTNLNNNNSSQPLTLAAVSSSFNITIRPDGKGISTFVGATSPSSSTPPEPPARLGSAGNFPSVQRSQTSLNSPNTVPSSSSPAYQLDSPTESGRYLTIKKIGVAATHSLNN